METKFSEVCGEAGNIKEFLANSTQLPCKPANKLYINKFNKLNIQNYAYNVYKICERKNNKQIHAETFPLVPDLPVIILSPAIVE